MEVLFPEQWAKVQEVRVKDKQTSEQDAKLMSTLNEDQLNQILNGATLESVLKPEQLEAIQDAEFTVVEES